MTAEDRRRFAEIGGWRQFRKNRRERDGYLSCPCGRGDYDLCTNCPYEECSVHGAEARARHEAAGKGEQG